MISGLVNHLIDFDDCSMVITEIINPYLMMIFKELLGLRQVIVGSCSMVSV